MSIETNHITKIFGEQKALNEVSFSMKEGEIVGFLGPNGAGKSTLMKILTGYITPTRGSATINGYDVIEQSLKIRESIGYLPETNPLYQDMYVREYLEFTAGMYQLNGNTRNRTEEMIRLTGLSPEQHKKIGMLSKGFRQRVGLAQALIHNPSVLILDEPTSGLDPNQIIDIRNLIKEIGKAKTILLSTHIMQEVEAICDRVIIINNGEIIADDSTQNIMEKAGEGNPLVVVEFGEPVNPSLFDDLPGVKNISKLSDTKFRIESSSKEDIRPAVFQFAVDKGLTVISLHQEKQNLENVFQQLTRS